MRFLNYRSLHFCLSIQHLRSANASWFDRVRLSGLEWIMRGLFLEKLTALVALLRAASSKSSASNNFFELCKSYCSCSSRFHMPTAFLWLPSLSQNPRNEKKFLHQKSVKRYRGDENFAFFLLWLHITVFIWRFRYASQNLEPFFFFAKVQWHFLSDFLDRFQNKKEEREEDVVKPRWSPQDYECIFLHYFYYTWRLGENIE